jgi:uncharacterized heparinase superfamily protein
VTVKFLNVTGEIGAAIGWNDMSQSRLWRYHLHYFDDLTSRDFMQRATWHGALLDRWVRENPPGRGTGWEPYPTSLRIVNWVKWRLIAGPASGGTDRAVVNSLAVQTRWLLRRLEVHILGNHLWANAKALLTAGLFFEGAEADVWRRRGLELLAAELDAQILADGGHFERSPMYHAIVLEDLLDLIQLAAVFPGVLPQPMVDRCRTSATRMLRWLRVMSHPDGQVSFFNDAAFGGAASYAVLATYADQQAVDVDRNPLGALEALPDSGYVRLENRRAIVLCDVAAVGPDYLPAHAHADTLSFELSVDGERVVVNGGTSTYEAGPERDRQRGTAAHSTIEVDGVNSSDVWAGFRVARRARAFDVWSGLSPAGPWVEGAHDGYQHRPGRVVHRRHWALEDAGLTVTDHLEGAFRRAVARLLLHPDAAAAGAGAVQIDCDEPVSMDRRPATWHPRFGDAVPTEVVEATMAGPRLVTRLRWP